MPHSRSNIDMIEALKYWRMKRSLSQSKLAHITGTSALTIGQLESGRRKARGHTLNKILQGLNMTEAEFFGMREGIPGAEPAVAAASALVVEEAPAPQRAVAAAPREPGTLRLSNLDLELLNRILNLDFEGKVEVLKMLQGLA
jgi:transcriptional regulator with XRE-family HTH domain